MPCKISMLPFCQRLEMSSYKRLMGNKDAASAISIINQLVNLHNSCHGK